MKVIFLDMDGVLCTYRSHVAQGCKPTPRGFMGSLDREAVGLLNVLAEALPEEVRYVCSSTWRKIYPLEWMENHLREHGWRGKFHEDWRTTSLPGGELETRGAEVADWLKRHPDIKEWVIIDDNQSFLPDQQARFVQTNYDNGLSWYNFLKACLVLHGNQTEYGRAVME